MAQSITRLESSSNSSFVLFVSFVVVVIALSCDQHSEWQSFDPTGCEPATFGTGEVGVHLTTKDTKCTKESESKAFDAKSPRCRRTSMAQPITRLASSSNSSFVLFVLFVSFVVVVIALNCDQRSEWRT